MARPRSAKGRATVVAARLADEYPGTERDLCALQHGNPFELLTATILSAQSTDEMVNRVTPELFRRWPDPASLAAAPTADVETVIHRTGFFRQKAKSIQGMARALVADYAGQVPTAMADLVTLPGVGRKTANVVRSVAFGEPGMPVDTHVGRLSRRLALIDTDDPVKAELALNALVPAAARGVFSLRLILHGRQVCTARRPECPRCVLQDVCPSAGVDQTP